MTAADHTGETFLQRQRRIRAEQEALERGVADWAKATAHDAALDLDPQDPRAQRWVQVKLDAQLAELAERAPGDRNHFLNSVAYSLGRLAPKWVDPTEVAPRLLEAALACGLEHREAVNTINSGLSGGMKDPRDPPVELDLFAGHADVSTGEVLEVGETAPGAPAEGDDEPRRPTLHEQMVGRELAMLRAREEARRIYAEERAEIEFRVPPSTLTLREELLLPDQPTQYAIAELLPVGGNALLTAQYKTGKTTVIGDYVRAHCDRVPFLDRFAVAPAPGRVAVWNYELSPDQYRRWLRELQIEDTDRACVLHARGFRIDLRTRKGQDFAVSWLVEREVSFWIPDPFARAATGVKENENSEVGEWLDTLDVIKERAGVRDLILPTHTGRAEQEAGQERARGATRLDDWTDVRWILTKDKQEVRYFRATGRDVDFGETKLTYDEATRRLHCGGGDRKWVEKRAKAQQILDFINANPGCSGRAIQAAVGGNKDLNTSLREDLVRRHKVRVEQGTVKQGEMHYANTSEA